MPQLFILNPGNWIIEDDDIPGNNTSRIRNLDTGTFQDFTHAADSITFLAGAAGVNLTVDFGDGLGAASFTVGSLVDGTQSPDSITIRNVETTGRVTLAARTIDEGSDADAAPDIVAGELVLSAFTGIGTSGNAIETMVSRLEAETEFEGIYLHNTGTITIGGLVGEVAGLFGSVTARDISLINAGSILLDAPNPGAFSSDNTVTGGRFGTASLIATGADSDIRSIYDSDPVDSSGPVLLRAGRDIIFGTNGWDHLVFAEGSLTLEAGRDVVLQGNGRLSTAFGGDVFVTAGRDITFADNGLALANGVARLTAGTGGTVTLGGFGFLVASGDLFVNADRLAIGPSFEVESQLASVTLAPASAGRGIIVGSATDTANALELSDAELDRVVAATDLIIGSHDAGRVQLTNLVGIQSTPDVIVRSGTNIDIIGLFLVSGDLTLSARDHVREFPTGAVGGGTLTVLVDAVDDDPGIGGTAFLGTSTGSTSTTLSGDLDADTLTGSLGADTINGAGGNDVLVGRNGNDTLDGGTGSDSMAGGLGDDIFYVDDAGDGVTEAVSEGRDVVYASVGYALPAGSSIEVLSSVALGGITALNFTGNGFAQEIYGNAGANMLDGGGGADFLAGLGGDDIYFISSGVEIIAEDAGQGRDIVYTGISYALNSGAQIEILSTSALGSTAAINLTGNAFGQEIYGNAGANTLNGGGGADFLVGMGGDDIYLIASGVEILAEDAGQGRDIVYTGISYALNAGAHIEILSTNALGSTTAINLTGNAFGQEIYGNAGANTLNGGGGADFLAGGGGADSFAFTTALGPTNIDTILDYQVGVDRFQLDDAVFAGLAPGALPAGAFRSGTAAQDADDRIIYNPATGAVFFDADGVGGAAAVQFAAVTPGLALGSGDFTVI